MKLFLWVFGLLTDILGRYEITQSHMQLITLLWHRPHAHDTKHHGKLQPPLKIHKQQDHSGCKSQPLTPFISNNFPWVYSLFSSLQALLSWSLTRFWHEIKKGKKKKKKNRTLGFTYPTMMCQSRELYKHYDPQWHLSFTCPVPWTGDVHYELDWQRDTRDCCQVKVPLKDNVPFPQ